MRYNVSKDGRDEVLKHAIANIYYYLEASDKYDCDDVLRFKYNIELPNKQYELLVLTNENEKEKEKQLLKIIREELGINHLELVDYKIHSMMRTQTTLIEFAVKMTKDDYLNCIYNRLVGIIPIVDCYCRDVPVDLEFVAQKYGVGMYRLLEPIYDGDEIPDPFKERLY